MRVFFVINVCDTDLSSRVRSVAVGSLLPAVESVGLSGISFRYAPIWAQSHSAHKQRLDRFQLLIRFEQEL